MNSDMQNDYKKYQNIKKNTELDYTDIKQQQKCKTTIKMGKTAGTQWLKKHTIQTCYLVRNQKYFKHVGLITLITQVPYAGNITFNILEPREIARF